MNLLQHNFLDDPWKMMCACICMNKARGDTVRRVLPELFTVAPTPEAMVGSDVSEITDLVRVLGFQNRRATSLIRASSDCLEGKVVGTWYGLGRYAIDSWMIFVAGAVIWPDDKELRGYLEWCAAEGVDPPGYANRHGEIVRPEPLRIMRITKRE